METAHSEMAQPCTECQAGQMHLKSVTYFTWLADELITVPDFPAWVCDVCGASIYDQRSINRLNLLLTPTAGKSSFSRPRRARPTISSKNQHAATE